MQTYTTLDGQVLRLDELSDGEAVFLRRCRAAYSDALGWRELANLVNGDENPVLEPGRRVTPTVAQRPLYIAARDLADRAAILQGALAFEAAVESDPFEDELVPISNVAKERGVTIAAVHKAIDRGTLVASSERPLMVSRNSLARWQVNATRQRAGRTRGAA